jgi:hypothetical protein
MYHFSTNILQFKQIIVFKPIDRRVGPVCRDDVARLPRRVHRATNIWVPHVRTTVEWFKNDDLLELQFFL